MCPLANYIKIGLAKLRDLCRFYKRSVCPDTRLEAGEHCWRQVNSARLAVALLPREPWDNIYIYIYIYIYIIYTQIHIYIYIYVYMLYISAAHWFQLHW